MTRKQDEVCWDCLGEELCDKHAAQKREAEYGRRATVQWASTIQPRRQVWLWENRIPMGTASALAGRGGTGKTTYAFHMIAQVSRGTLPGTYYGSPRPCLIWSGEDEWDKVIVPRLIAADADLNKVGRLVIDTYIDGETREVTPRVPMDTTTIGDTVKEVGAALVLIDPIASTMTGDLNREADVRSAVDALARIGQDTGAVMMFIRHFGKGGGNASDKMSGSHAFRDAVRSVFLFAPDGDRVIVTQDKGNYAPAGEESFAFQLQNTSVPTTDGFTDVARVLDLGASDTSVGDIINRTTDGDTDDRADIDKWLTDLLANGSVKANEVYSSADAAGFSKDQAKRAKKRLGIQAVRETGDGPWFWKLDTKGAGDQGSTPDTQELAPLLPCTSEGVRETDSGPREQGAQACSLGGSLTQNLGLPAGVGAVAPTPLTVRKQELRARRTIRVRGQEMPRCLVCGKAVMAGQGDTHLSCSKQPTEVAS